MRTVVVPEAQTPRALRRQVLALQDQAWPPAAGAPPSTGLTHDPALGPVSVLLVDDDGSVTGALDVLSSTLHHAGHDWAASGLSTVVVDRAARGRGLGRDLVRAAAGWIERSGADLTVFTCDAPLAPFYLGAGYRLLPGTVVVGGTPAQPLRSDDPAFAGDGGKLTLAAFHSGRARSAADAFAGVELLVYPGEVDRLW